MVCRRSVERTGPAIHATLAAHAPREREAFESDFAGALDVAGQTYDLAPLQGVLDRWWDIATRRADPTAGSHSDGLRDPGDQREGAAPEDPVEPPRVPERTPPGHWSEF